ncbi:hypothetical protein FM076_23800 [Streptomyces albus subsp. chlorinus]|nr:hypothetical protein [Streptomyces albus subsp. chlorinus]
MHHGVPTPFDPRRSPGPYDGRREPERAPPDPAASAVGARRARRPAPGGAAGHARSGFRPRAR